MKVTFKLALLAIFCLFISSSCKKEKTLPEKDFFSIKIDGVLVEFTYNIVANNDFSASASGKMLRIVGSAPYETMNININNYKGVGEYALNTDQRQILGAYTKKIQVTGKEENYILTEGTVGITSVTEDRIKGVFFFTATNYDETTKKTISEGKFSLRITK